MLWAACSALVAVLHVHNTQSWQLGRTKGGRSECKAGTVETDVRSVLCAVTVNGMSVNGYGVKGCPVETGGPE